MKNFARHVALQAAVLLPLAALAPAAPPASEKTQAKPQAKAKSSNPNRAKKTPCTQTN